MLHDRLICSDKRIFSKFEDEDNGRFNWNQKEVILDFSTGYNPNDKLKLREKLTAKYNILIHRNGFIWYLSAMK